jgi:hypothetical protein
MDMQCGPATSPQVRWSLLAYGEGSQKDQSQNGQQPDSSQIGHR